MNFGKICNMIFRKWGGGSKSVWNFCPSTVASKKRILIIKSPEWDHDHPAIAVKPWVKFSSGCVSTLRQFWTKVRFFSESENKGNLLNWEIWSGSHCRATLCFSQFLFSKWNWKFIPSSDTNVAAGLIYLRLCSRQMYIFWKDIFSENCKNSKNCKFCKITNFQILPELQLDLFGVLTLILCSF